MKRVKLIGLALVAMLALGATTIASTVSAATPELLPGAGTSFTGKSGKGRLRTLGGKEITCEKATSKGEATSTKAGTGEARFEGCTSENGLVKCTGLGDATSGNITIKATTVDLVGGLLSGKEVTALAVLLTETVHFSCSIVLVEAQKGTCMAGLVKELDKLVKTLTVLSSESAANSGDPDIPSIFENLGEGAKAKECALKLSTSGGAPESGAIKGEGTIEGFKNGGKEVTVLIDS